MRCIDFPQRIAVEGNQVSSSVVSLQLICLPPASQCTTYKVKKPFMKFSYCIFIYIVKNSSSRLGLFHYTTLKFLQQPFFDSSITRKAEYFSSISVNLFLLSVQSKVELSDLIISTNTINLIWLFQVPTKIHFRYFVRKQYHYTL